MFLVNGTARQQALGLLWEDFYRAHKNEVVWRSSASSFVESHGVHKRVGRTVGDGCAPQEVRAHIKRCNFREPR